MTFIQAFSLIMALIAIPACLGLVCIEKGESPLFIWVKGTLILWAIFYVCALPLIITKNTAGNLYLLSGAVEITAAVICIIIFIIRKHFNKNSEQATLKTIKKLSKNEIIYLGLFLTVVLFQLYKTVFYSYADGDDAYYIGQAQLSSLSDIMYLMDPYNGTPVDYFDYRYALAPFPMIISMLSRLSGLNASIIAHSVWPPFLIIMTYVIYNETSRLLFKDNREKRYMFMCLLSVFIMFENVSTSTQGTFLLTRSRQGKAALANIIIPMLFYLGLRIINEKHFTLNMFIAALSVTVASALASVFGNVLASVCIGIICLYMLIKKYKFKYIFSLALTVLPNIVIALLYLRWS